MNKYQIGDLIYYSDGEQMQESKIVDIDRWNMYYLDNNCIVTEESIVGKINIYDKVK